jgi:tetratricopeptide (TPR) repeat protein
MALILAFTGNRLPGDTATGSVSLSATEQLNRTLTQAETLEAQGDLVDALKLYQQVLRSDSNQPEALAESGWLEFEAGVAGKSSRLLDQGQETEEAAVQAAPGAWAPRLYLGSMLLAEGNASGAVDEFRQFLGDNPPADKVTAAMPYLVKAFSSAGQPLPPLPAGVSPPTTGSASG